MSSRCRYCGTLQGDPPLSDDGACPRCAASVECARCGHPRRAHVGTFRDGRGCSHVWVEGATLATGCTCAGFAPAGAESLDEELLLVAQARPAGAPVLAR